MIRDPLYLTKLILNWVISIYFVKDNTMVHIFHFNVILDGDLEASSWSCSIIFIFFIVVGIKSGQNLAGKTKLA